MAEFFLIIARSNLFNLRSNHPDANSGIVVFNVHSSLNFNGYIKNAVQLEFKLSITGGNFKSVTNDAAGIKLA